MVISFGAPQVWLELAQNLEDPEWNQMLGEFGWMYSLSTEEKLQASNGKLSEAHFSWFGANMTPNVEMTESKLPSLNGKFSTSAS